MACSRFPGDLLPFCSGTGTVPVGTQLKGPKMAAQNEVIRLWPDGPPTKLEDVGAEVEYSGAVGTTQTKMLRNISDPTLTVFRPEKPNGVGVVVCPGGGWRILAWEHEGTD